MPLSGTAVSLLATTPTTVAEKREAVSESGVSRAPRKAALCATISGAAPSAFGAAFCGRRLARLAKDRIGRARESRDEVGRKHPCQGGDEQESGRAVPG